MTSELSVFAARLRELIPLWLEDGDALPDTRDAEFNGYALLLFALQFGNNPVYRKLCEARGVMPDSLTHWSQIPAVPTSAFKDFDVTCLPPEQRTAVFHSSGTTEQRPSRHFHNAESLEVYEASLWPWFCRHVVPDSQISNLKFQILTLTPPPAKAPHSSLVHMFEAVRRQMRAPENVFYGGVGADGAWSLDCQRVEARLAEAGRPVLVLGTAFSFVHLVDHLGDNNLRLTLPEGSRVMETGGYKGRSRTMPKAELHGLITRHLGVPASHIICEYGMSELSSQAYDQPGSHRGNEVDLPRTFHFPPWARPQIVSPETGTEVADGETGLVRLFDLANVYSVMALQTEDLAVRRGDGFELLGRASEAEARGCSLMSMKS